MYSRVPNKRTGRLLENEKKSHLYAVIRNYTIINFQQKVPPIRLFPHIFSRLFVIFFMNFSRILADFQGDGFPRLALIIISNEAPECWIIYGPLLSTTKKFPPIRLLFSRNFPTYTFIQSYILISFWGNFPPILLFGLVVYSEL